MRRVVNAGAAALLIGLFGGCAHELGELEPFPCAENGLCPEGWSCSEGLCRRGLIGEPDGSTEQPDAASATDASNPPDASAAADAGKKPDAGEVTVDGGLATDAGVADGGSSPDAGYPTRALAWGQMALPASPNPMPSIRAVHGISPTEVYAVGGGGLVFRYDGEQWRTAYTESSGALLRGVHARPDGAVFAVGEGVVLRCAGSCDSAASYVAYRPTGVSLTSLCGDGDRVFAVGALDGAGVIYGFDGAQSQPWVVRLTDPARTFKGCWVAPDGAVFLTSRTTDASGEVLRWKSALTPETIHFVGVSESLMFFNPVWGQGDEVFIAGSRKNIFSRDSLAEWSPVFKPNNMGETWAMTGDGVEVYTGGAMFSGDTSYQLVARKNGVWDWCEGPPITISGLWSANPRTYFAVGWDETNKGRIYLGER